MPTVSDALARACLLMMLAAAPARAQSPVNYRVSFPSPEHRWMQVDATFADVPAGPLAVRMSRTSPGRYALHEFVKNVFDVRIADGKGKPLTAVAAEPASVGRAGPRRHGGDELPRVRRPHRRHLSQRRLDARPPEHAGIADVGARASRPAPPGCSSCRRPASRGRWRRSSSRPTTRCVYTAPNLHYLMDSPTEVGDVQAPRLHR